VWEGFGPKKEVLKMRIDMAKSMQTPESLITAFNEMTQASRWRVAKHGQEMRGFRFASEPRRKSPGVQNNIEP